MITPRVPSGVLDLLPREQIAFNRMTDTIRAHFERHGFLPIDTPVFELTEVLLTKSGGDNEKQVYFVQSTGQLEKGLAEGERPELALRFDCTVPMARYVAQHEHQLAFPYRRYAIQKNYRGERPQRGRGREFYQCDIDIIGKDDLPVVHDAEPLAAAYDAYRAIGLDDVRFHVNNRHLLRGFFEAQGIAEAAAQAEALREVDKLAKRGPEAVRATLAQDHGLDDARLDAIMALVTTRSAGHDDALARLTALRGVNAELDRGVDELIEVLDALRMLGLPEEAYCVDFAISRGLDYYTGTVYEGYLASDESLGAVGGGGRYDNLAGFYTRSRLPGVGYSIGLLRCFTRLQESGALDETPATTAQVLVPLLSLEHRADVLAFTARLRAAGVNTEAVLVPGKLAKQFKYANKAGIRWVAVIGDEEAAHGTVTVKDMVSGEQVTVAADEAISRIAQG